MAFYAIYQESDGALVSLCSENPKRLRAGLVVLELQAKPDDKEWDAANRAFVQKPVKRVVDVLQLFANDNALQTILAKLTAQERQTLANRILFLFGGKRHITAQTAIEMGVPANRITGALVDKPTGR